MLKSPEAPSNRRVYPHDRVDERDQVERIYPYPAIPRSVRPYLERCFEITDIDRVDPTDNRELSRLRRLSEINKTLGLVRAYCGAELSGSAYKAAALSDLEDAQAGLGDRRHPSIRASDELGKFFVANADGQTPAEVTKNIYIAGLLQDRQRLDRFRCLAESSDDALDYDSGAPAPSSAEWLSDPAITNADVLYEVVETTNIESILISGAETLVKLQTSPANDRQTLDLVRYSEQIIAPIAEVIGFDTLAMSLNSATKSIRLTNGGRGYLLDRANAMIERFRSYDRGHSLAHNVTSAFQDVVRHTVGDDSLELHPNLPVSYGDDNQSVYGDTSARPIETADGTVNAAWRFRLKTPGSLAWKMYQDEKRGRDIGITPMDLLGITAVVDNDTDQIKLFHTLANGLYHSDDLRPFPAPSKTSPIHIRGMADYINRIADGLSAAIGGRKVDSPDALHYAKVTGFYGNLPFEIQCVTRHYRDSMQIGPLAHIIYKANAVGKMTSEEVKRWTNLLSSIRKRRARLGVPGLIGSTFDTKNGQVISVGKNEQQAREFITEMTSSRQIIDRTIGFVATESGVAEEPVTV